MLTPICPGHRRWSLSMSVRSPIACYILFAMAVASFAPSAKAGPLLDWLFGHHHTARPAYPVGPPVAVGNTANYAPGYAASMPAVPAVGYPVSGYAANYGNYYGSMMPVIGPSGYGYPAAQPGSVAAATAPSIMSYVPDYRTTQYRAPVTYYRPLMTTDPNTGSQVVALAPCTSYEYQTQRVPTFGYNGVMGSYSTPPVVAPPPTMPTYTLPSGGVPIAGGPAAVLPPNSSTYAMGYGAYSSPVTAPPTYSSGYGSPYRSYSIQQPVLPQQSIFPQQPALTAPPAGNYPTQPLSSTPGYYGSVSGGSTGGSTGSYATPSYAAPGYVAPATPGLFAPPASSYNPAPSHPYNYSPQSQPPSYPLNPVPGSLPYRDPAGDVPPVLPPPGTSAQMERPQLKAIVRQPLTANNSLKTEPAPQPESRQTQGPTMSPIPVPSDFEQQPRWNPGLLNEQDRTARNPVTPDTNEHAGQSKSIQWASFKSESKPEPARQPSGLRAVTPYPSSQPAVQNLAVQNQPAKPAAAPRPAPQYNTGGWNTVK